MELKKVQWAKFSDENKYREKNNQMISCEFCRYSIAHYEERHNTRARVLRCDFLKRDFPVSRNKVCNKFIDNRDAG